MPGLVTMIAVSAPPTLEVAPSTATAVAKVKAGVIDTAGGVT